MSMFTKKTAFGTIAIAASGLIIAGAAAPALASDADSSTRSLSNTSRSATHTEFLNGITNGLNGGDLDLLGGDSSTGDISNDSPLVVAPETGDVLSGNAVASGNDVSAPVEAPIASGNDASIGDLNTGDVNTGDVNVGGDTSVSDIVDNTLDGALETDGFAADIIDNVDLGAILGD